MIKEDYVSFEVAKLLKEKGFVIPYDSFRGVYINGKFKRLNPGSAYGYNDKDEIIEACSLQIAMKWLREVYKLYVSVIPNPLNYKHQDIQDGWACEVTHLSDLSYDSDYEFFQKKYQTYESACEAAIRYCLEKLI